MDPQPTVGRIVHYNRPEVGLEAPIRDCAAIVTAVDEDGTVALTVFPPLAAPEVTGNVPYVADGGEVATWHWPERV